MRSKFHMALFSRKILSLTAAAGLLLGVCACDQARVQSALEAIRDKGELTVITRNNVACYYEGPYGPTGFEYELAKSFAEYLGVSIRPVIIEDEADMVEALLKGEADIIAAGFPIGPQTARLVKLGPSYLSVQQVLVGRRNGMILKSIADVAPDSLTIFGNSSRLTVLNSLKDSYPGLSWRIANNSSAEDMLQLVWNESLPLTLIESNILKLNHRFYPELVPHFSVGDPQDLNWAIHPSKRQLLRAVYEWFGTKAGQERLAGLKEHYYSHLEDFDYVDLVRYRQRIQARLPKYRSYFEDAAGKHGLDWRLMAALSYQESHWDPAAVSFTGVRGIMMITGDTAKTLGLKNRLEVKDSISAAARYLARLHEMVGDDVPEPDRTLLALASYNIGPGHVQDARKLAEELKRPSNTWHGVRSVLPLLQKRKYYSALPKGYARGSEAVQYVDRIRTYHKVLDMALETDFVSQKNERPFSGG